MLNSSKTLTLLLTVLISLNLIGQEQQDSVETNEIKFVGDPQLSIEEYLSISQKYSEGKDFDSALYYLSAAEIIANSLDDVELLADVKYKQGRVFDKQSLYTKSESYYLEAIDLYSQIPDTTKTAKTYSRLGIGYKHSAKYSKAFEAFNNALKFNIYANDSMSIASTKVNIGNVFKNIGKLERAKMTYMEALSIFIKYEDKVSIGNCYNNIGNVHKNQYNYDSAFYYMHQTKGIRLETEDDRGLSFIYHNLANLHLRLENPDSALHYIDESYRLKVKAGDLKGQAVDLEVYAEIYMLEENWQKSIRYLETAMFLTQDHEDLEFRESVLKNLGLCYNKVGDYRKSSESFVEFLKNEETLDDLYSKEQLEEELLKYELLSDSIRMQQLILQKDLQEAKNENIELSNKVLKKNLYLLGAGILLLLLVFVPMLIRYRQRLKASKESHKILEKTSVPKEEKEILLKEVHHRVKNNFQIINSLIRIQSEFMTADNFKIKLKDIETRIRSMALIHERLYKSDKISRLKVKDYLTELTGNIIESYETSTKINFNLEVDEVEYSIDTLIPLGLIMNETISNSIKHAYKGAPSGDIDITLKNTDEQSVLVIQDNGKGSNESIETLKEESLGLELILDLTEQLDGKLDLQTEKGFIYSFTFPRLK